MSWTTFIQIIIGLFVLAFITTAVITAVKGKPKDPR